MIAGSGLVRWLKLPGRGWLAALAAVCLSGFALRAAYYRASYYLVDEEIALKVVGHMRQSGDWDTNWAKADLPPDLRYDQYNFSSHLEAAYFFYRGVKLIPGTEVWRSTDEGRWVYRFFSVLLAALAVGQTIALAQRAGGRDVALAAGALAAVSSQLVQDAHFARPEPFVTVLTLAVVACCWPRERLRAGWVLAGFFVLGLLLACKVSMVLLAWLPLVPTIAGWRDAPARNGVLAFGLPALFTGFLLGAPGAVAHPAQFLHGVQHLVTQYGGAHPPHSHLNGGRVADLMGDFFRATLGWPLLAAAVLGGFRLTWRRQWAELALIAGPLLLFAGYFSTQTVFFERNLSHILPLLFVLAALGVKEFAHRLGGRTARGPMVWMAALALLVALRPLQRSAALVLMEFSGRGEATVAKLDRLMQAEYPGAVFTAKELLVAPDVESVAAHFKTSKAPLLLRLCDYRDEWTAACVRQLESRFDAKLVAENVGSFPGVPTSTLVVYHSWTDRYYLITGPR